MKYSKTLPLLVVSLLFLIIACQTTSVEDELDYIPGEVIISMEIGVQLSDIKPRIEELELEWVEYFEYLRYALIGVPVGEEEFWVQILKDEPMIKHANLNRKVEQR